MVKRKKAKEDILLALLKNKESTRRELQKETNYSWGMVSQVVAALIEEGLIEEGPKINDPGKGRNAKTLRLVESSCCIGADFNAGGIRVSVFALDGEPVFEKVTPNDARSQEEAIALLFKCVEEAKEQAGRKAFRHRRFVPGVRLRQRRALSFVFLSARMAALSARAGNGKTLQRPLLFGQ